MDDEMLLPTVAANRAWTLYLAVHDDVDPLDARRCTLERYLRQRWQAGECNAEELTCSSRARSGRHLVNTMGELRNFVRRLVTSSARPDVVLAAIAGLVSGMVVLALRFVFGVCP